MSVKAEYQIQSSVEAPLGPSTCQHHQLAWHTTSRIHRGETRTTGSWETRLPVAFSHMLELSNRRREAAKCHYLYTNGQARGWHGEGGLWLPSCPRNTPVLSRSPDRVQKKPPESPGYNELLTQSTYDLRLSMYSQNRGLHPGNFYFRPPLLTGIQISCWEMWEFCWNCDCLEHTQFTDGRQRNGLWSIWKLSVSILLVTTGIYGNCPFLSSLQTPLCYMKKREKITDNVPSDCRSDQLISASESVIHGDCRLFYIHYCCKLHFFFRIRTLCRNKALYIDAA